MRSQRTESTQYRPGLAALAELARGDQFTRSQSAAEAVKVIRTLPEERQPGIFEAMIDLAPITLGPYIIDQIRKETGMLSLNAAADFYSTTEVGMEVRDRGRREGIQEGSAKAVMTLLRGRLGADPRIPAVARRIVRSPDMEAYILALPSLESLDDLPPELLTDS